MTEQEVFDKIWEGMKGQNFERSTAPRSGSACKYRGPNGLKCAAGHLIPDALYTPNLEGMDVTYEPVIKVLREAGLEEHLGLIGKCQESHDSAQHSQDVRNGLRAVAARRHLVVPY